MCLWIPELHRRVVPEEPRRNKDNQVLGTHVKHAKRLSKSRFTFDLQSRAST